MSPVRSSICPARASRSASLGDAWPKEESCLSALGHLLTAARQGSRVFVLLFYWAELGSSGDEPLEICLEAVQNLELVVLPNASTKGTLIHFEPRSVHDRR